MSTHVGYTLLCAINPDPVARSFLASIKRAFCLLKHVYIEAFVCVSYCLPVRVASSTLLCVDPYSSFSFWGSQLTSVGQLWNCYSMQLLSAHHRAGETDYLCLASRYSSTGLNTHRQTNTVSPHCYLMQSHFILYICRLTLCGHWGHWGYISQLLLVCRQYW